MVFSYLWGIFQGVNYRGRVIVAHARLWIKGSKQRNTECAANYVFLSVAKALSWRAIFFASFLSSFSLPRRQWYITSEPMAQGRSLSPLISIPTHSDLPHVLFMAIKLWNVHKSDCWITPFFTRDSGMKTLTESRLISSVFLNVYLDFISVLDKQTGSGSWL